MAKPAAIKTAAMKTDIRSAKPVNASEPNPLRPSDTDAGKGLPEAGGACGVPP